MSRIQQRKVFRALGALVVEKRFIDADAVTPEGWHDDQLAALAAYQGVESSEEVKLRRGRPRKGQ